MPENEVKTDKCGVILPNVKLCGSEAVVTVTSANGDYVLLFCEEHANLLYINREELFVQETTDRKEKRIFGIQLPKINTPESSESGNPVQPYPVLTTGLETNEPESRGNPDDPYGQVIKENLTIQ